MIKILHTADVHLQQVGDERWQALEAVLSTAQQEKIDVVTIAGDLFNQDFDAHQARDVLRGLFSQQNYQIILLPGNHDSRSYQQTFYFGDNVTLINDFKKIHNIKDVAFVGIPFEPLNGQELLQRLEFINDQLDENNTNVLLFHGELTDLFFSQHDFGGEGEKRYLPLKLNLLADTKFDYILAGHFHTNFVCQPLPNQRLEQGGFFVYPGSPVSITTKETGQRSVALIKTGQAPQQKLVKTHHYQEILLQLRPEKNHTCLNKLEKKLQELPPKAVGLIKVDGYFDSEKFNLTEPELKKEITKLADKYNSLFKAKDYHVKEVGTILNSGLYQTLSQQLQAKGLEPDRQKHLENIIIQAMAQLNA
jgi:DNA repair exonuclease SbcCD nuclease subunit